jgi:hypothetical protein
MKGFHFPFGFCVGLAVTVIAIWLATEPLQNVYISNTKKIIQCQETLPRNQTCELVAVPKDSY